MRTGRPRIASNCLLCGQPCHGRRAAYRHCQQRGRQRDGYRWRGHETPDEALKRRMDAIRADPLEMALVEDLAEFCVSQFPPDLVA